jgi:signal transduction histidine kinase
MLAMSRLGPQHALADMKNVNLNDIAQDVCAELIPLAMRRDQTLEILTTTGSMMVTGQTDLLHRLIENLVDNAMRCAPPHCQILLTLGNAVNGLRLTVSGTGLGLAICRKIAAMHHAQMSLSEGPNGRGLSVHVDFPSGA